MWLAGSLTFEYYNPLCWIPVSLLSWELLLFDLWRGIFINSEPLIPQAASCGGEPFAIHQHSFLVSFSKTKDP